MVRMDRPERVCTRRISSTGSDDEKEESEPKQLRSSTRLSRREMRREILPMVRRLRERKPVIRDERPSTLDSFLEMDRKQRLRKKRRRAASGSSDSSSSDSSTDEKVSRGNRPRQSPYDKYDKPEKVGSKKGFIDIHPITVDPTITFESVGGLEAVIGKLREIVVLPLIYKEFYTARNITPPRGILFHGPPGTGKTLLARALANECSDVGGRKVSFFVRKGADLLSKWVGESERHLRQLFEAASRCQPSIIFFDEIDGLAPARSSKTDQVHNSVVSTLLAELDGVQDRGDIIIIGATNRINSLDPALRRPGRFDYEFPFLLPTLEGRVQIIRSHVSKWSEVISENVIQKIAARCVGFSGADLKLLCAEASMCALRRRYPQIYASKQRYLLNYESIQVEPSDWGNAMKKVNRSSDRSFGSNIAAGKPLPKAVVPLLKDAVECIQMRMKKLYALREDDALFREPASKRFLVYATPGHEDNGVDQYIIPAVLHIFESVPVFTLSLESFSLQDANSDCKAIADVFAEAGRVNKFAIVLIPSLNIILKMISEQSQEVLQQKMMSTEKPILVVATVAAQSNEDEMADVIFNFFRGFSYQVKPPSLKCRKQFLQPVFSIRSMRLRIDTVKEEPILDDLPLGPALTKVLSPDELRVITKKETSMLRSLRKFLREVLAKLARNKKYCDFTTPVDITVVPDYHDIIDNPMDFEAMMCKLDLGVYNSAAEFLEDIHLIKDNAVAYNPRNTEAGKSIIHRAHELVDYAHLIIEDEMDSDFEEACQNITKQRKERADQAEAVQAEAQSPTTYNGYVKTNSKSPAVNSSSDRSCVRSSRLSDSRSAKFVESDTMISKRRGRRKKIMRMSSTRKSSSVVDVSRQNGIIDSDDDDEIPITELMSKSQNHTITLTSDTDSDAENGFSTQFADCGYKFVKCTNYSTYEKTLSDLLTEALKASESMGVLRLLDFRYQLMFAIEGNYHLKDKKNLLTQLKEIIKDYAKPISQIQADA